MNLYEFIIIIHHLSWLKFGSMNHAAEALGADLGSLKIHALILIVIDLASWKKAPLHRSIWWSDSNLTPTAAHFPSSRDQILKVLSTIRARCPGNCTAHRWYSRHSRDQHRGSYHGRYTCWHCWHGRHFGTVQDARVGSGGTGAHGARAVALI